MPSPERQDEALARALLREGLWLYPYRASALKNRQRHFFGGIYPPAWSARNTGDPCVLGTECLLETTAETTIQVRVLFLQHALAGDDCERSIGMPPVPLEALRQEPACIRFEFDAGAAVLLGQITVGAQDCGDGLARIRLHIENLTDANPPHREDVLPCTLASTLAMLHTQGGSWVSLIDPPADRAAAAQACVQQGLFPVLSGRTGSRDRLLAAPIILPEYPRLAPESRGDLFDNTEIDELLTLRVLTLSEAEKAELRRATPAVRGLLERATSLTPAELARLHGALRDLHGLETAPPAPMVAVAPGAKVRLRPRRSADALDALLAGKLATVRAVEHDVDGGVQLTVTVDEDPGADLGVAGYHGHRFFFHPDEVEPW
ncbi:MAG: hypothetical protein P4L83_14180 [Nevskia sp.]|nr:hypothetical protein [Nevskia sp.]